MRPGTVLITGGLGALGLHAARWLASRGAQHILLTDLGGPATPKAKEAVAELEKLGARVTVAALDVSDREALARVLAEIPKELPLRGVVHAAGLLDDGVVSAQDATRLARVLAPKGRGAWHLHELTREAELDFFVLYSSVAGLMGSAGQSNYGAANAFLDGLARLRRAAGLPALSAQWGPWAGGGMSAGLSQADRARLGRQGFGLLEPGAALAALGSALQSGASEALIVALDLEALGPEQVPAMLRGLVKPRAAPRAAASTGELVEKLRRLPEAERRRALLESVRAEIGRVLGGSSGLKIGEGAPLRDLGLDSLMSVELRNALGKRVGKELPATLAFDYPTAGAIADYLLTNVLGLAKAKGGEETAETDDDLAALVGEVQGFSEEEALEMLEAELEQAE